MTLQKVSDKLDLGINTTEAAVEQTGRVHYRFRNAAGIQRQPEAKLVYFTKANGGLAITWRMETDIHSSWLLTYMDATGSDEVHGVVDYVSHLSASMNVFPWRVEDPEDGPQTIVKKPWNIDTSPFTWFGDGKEECNTTRGNNAFARLNPTGGTDWVNNYRPEDKNRHFEYTYLNTPTDVSNSFLVNTDGVLTFLVSNRLTGGPANTGCLGGEEASGMGEGWSDLMGVAIHTKSTDTRYANVNFAHWVSNMPAGYRQYPYSTDKKVNPLTYGSADNKSEVHEIGTIWGNVLYEVMWNIIDKHGNSKAEFPVFN